MMHEYFAGNSPINIGQKYFAGKSPINIGLIRRKEAYKQETRTAAHSLAFLLFVMQHTQSQVVPTSALADCPEEIRVELPECRRMNKKNKSNKWVARSGSRAEDPPLAMK